MLKELTIKNFTSFRDETTFSMEADTERVSEHHNHIVDINGNELLKVSSIYGPNGGGKSNLLKALLIPKYLQRAGHYRLNFEVSCIFDNTEDIEETLFFVTDEFEIGYHFIVQSIGSEEDIEDSETDGKVLDIMQEDIVYRRKNESDFITMCSRKKDGSVVGDDFLSLFENKEFKLAKRQSIIQYGYDLYANNDSDLPEQFSVLKKLYEQIASIIDLDFTSKFIAWPFVEQNILKHRKTLIRLLNEIDLSIADIKFYKNKPNPIYFSRKVTINGKEIEKELPLKSESTGTQKIFWILLRILSYGKNRIFYCDDMNAFLHPKLFRAVIKLFQENNSETQLIFNSHDILNMNNDLFRRDEIWFAYRDETYSTKLVSLSNIVNYKGEQVRKDAKYYKQYLEGKYGADPFIAKGLSWHE